MRMTRRRLAAVSVVGIALLFIAHEVIGATRSPVAVPVRNAQTAELITLLRRQERAIFDSMVSGNVHDFPTIFYNDPWVHLGDGFKAAITRVVPIATASKIAN